MYDYGGEELVRCGWSAEIASEDRGRYSEIETDVAPESKVGVRLFRSWDEVETRKTP